MESVTVHTITISKKGEWKYFQVRLPKDAKKIIGVETGLHVLDELPFEVAGAVSKRFGIERNNLMGELKLQSLDTANIFYAKDIVEEDRNMANDRIRINNYEPPNERRFALMREAPPPDLWQPLFPWTHGKKLEEEGLLMLHNPVIAGIYRDAIGKQYETDIQYKVMLYIWHDS
jgi:hypothetical protein